MLWTHFTNASPFLAKNTMRIKSFSLAPVPEATTKERSDIDLAIYGISEKDQSSFWSDIDDLPTHLEFDLVHITPDTNPELIQNIEKDGVILYEKSC